MHKWRCGCPICRALAHTLLRLAGGKFAGSAEEAPGAEEEREEETRGGSSEAENVALVEKWKEKPFVVVERVGPPEQAQPALVQAQQVPGSEAAIPAPPTPSQGGGQGSAQSSAGASNPGGEAARAESESQPATPQAAGGVPKEILERVQQLEEELTKMKNYVRASIDGIKATLVDLRSAIAELSNPFNILRKYADILFGDESEARGRRAKGEREQEAPKPQPAYYVPNVLPVVVPAAALSGQQVGQEVKPAAAEAVTEGGASAAGARKLEPALRLDDPESLKELVLWMNKALERVGVDGVEKLLEGYVKGGLMSPEAGDALKCVLQVVVKLREAGVPPEEQAAIVAGALLRRGGREGSSHAEEGRGGEGEEGSAGEELLKLIEGG